MNRPEYQRPQFERNQWLNLNGTWQFDFTDNLEEQFPQVLTQTIEVPYVFQSQQSGIAIKTFHDSVWYQRKLEIPEKWQDKRLILHFGAVDYQCWVYINHKLVGQHIGGHTSFSFDVTEYLTFSDDLLTVKVFDPSTDEEIPRGKQYWHEESAAIWYTRTTGIWQTVWLEAVAKEGHLEKVFYTSEFDKGNIEIAYHYCGDLDDKELHTKIYYDEKLLVSDRQLLQENQFKRSYSLFNQKIDRSDFHGSGWTWTPETPNLFQVVFEVWTQGNCIDTVNSYFGMRKVHIQDGMVHLNNRPYYQKLVLDQGYWPTSLMTAPTDDDYRKDIELAKSMGFNGCRKHQKVEDPRFLYWADKLGFIVWGECASPSVYTRRSAGKVMNEWQEIIDRDYNHPSITTWVPINESWGVPEISVDRQQQHFSQAIYHFLHSLDTTRLVISNDGWEMTETDICAIHSYVHGTKEEQEKYQYFIASLQTKQNVLASEPNRRKIYCSGFTHQEVPILLTEFGGIGFDKDSQGWGYTNATSESEFIQEYQRVLEAVYQSEILHGFCYTQLTDVEQEKNGLLTADRQPKCSIEAIKQINSRWHPTIVNKIQLAD
jgi:beta-galactosidase/beta-glucuronidase